MSPATPTEQIIAQLKVIASALDDKNSEYLADATVDRLSACCAASVYLPDICAACGEHS